MNIFLAEIHDDSTRTLQEERVYLYTEKIAAAYGFCVAAIFSVYIGKSMYYLVLPTKNAHFQLH